MYEFIRIFKLSPMIALKKVVNKFVMYFKNKKLFKAYTNERTYIIASKEYQSLPYSIFPLEDSKFLEHYREQLFTSVALCCSHQFDLLGSGITKVEHGLRAEGMGKSVYNHKSTVIEIADFAKVFSNQGNVKHITQYLTMLPNTYKLIDWQIDFKSGFRWSENQLSKQIIYGDKLGADIKVPWELGRMQHLVYLPLAANLASNEEQSQRADFYHKEFCNQIVDFYISNPPHYGTQWMSTMDVAIRAVNIVLAYNLFLQAGFHFEKRFEQLFFNLIADHHKFISENLEWSSGMRANHYLAGIAGLIIVSCYLPASEAVDNVLLFALKELEQEIFHQFYPDGGNFESSLSYHRFAFEMVSFSLFHFLAIPKSRFMQLYSNSTSKCKHISILKNGSISISKALSERLLRMFEFQLYSTSRSQYLPQIGDNDSGYFLRISPFFLKFVSKSVEKKDYFFHNSNNSWNVLSFYAGFFNEFFENDIFGRYLEYYSGKTMREKANVEFDFSSLRREMLEIRDYLNEKSDSDAVRCKEFPHFGLYNVRRRKYNFIFRCGRIGQLGKGGHDHNDQLSFELILESVPFIVDPGTYCYTPFPRERNRFRSVHSHNTLVFSGVEQNKWQNNKKDDLFWLDGDSTKAIVTKFSDKIINAEHSAYSDKHFRYISLDSNEIKFTDKCNRKGRRRVLLHFIPGVELINEQDHIKCSYKYLQIIIPKGNYEYAIEDYLYSSHYGILQEAKRLAICSNNIEINWSIRL